MNFSNSQIEIDDLPKLDNVELKSISKHYLKIIIINKLIVYLVVFAALIFTKVFVDKTLVQENFWYVFSVFSIILIVNFIHVVLAFKKRKYAVREHDVIYGKGLLVHSLTAVPISRIQHIEESRSWLARQFNLSTLNLYTAGESGSDLSIKGLPHTEAKQINDFISGKVNGK